MERLSQTEHSAFRQRLDFCFRYRWAVAALLFTLCVILRLHGSSIGVYDEIFPAQNVPVETTLIGSPRWVRSDEFGVATPAFFSQAYNRFCRYSTRMSISPTNMVLDYYSPVRDFTALGKPLAWGYLLFGNEIGLSWYWCGMVILLFMTALEMCLILTRDHRSISLAGAVMVALSPEVQWWMLPHMPIVLLYAMWLFAAGYGFFTARSELRRWACAGLASIGLIGFSLSIFPSFQVPCAYIVFALLVACLLRDRTAVTISRRSLLPFLSALAVAGCIVGSFCWSSREDIGLLMGTVYPGSRAMTGGDEQPQRLFFDLRSLFLPYRDANTANNSEVSTFVHFGPFFLALAPLLIVRLRRKQELEALVAATFCAILVVQALFMLVGVPQAIADVTLLRYCNRMHGVYDWAATLFTVWGISCLIRHPNILGPVERIAYPVAFALVSLLFTGADTRAYFALLSASGALLGTALIVAAITAVTLVLLLATHQRSRMVFGVITALMIFCGATVNPIERGVGALTNHPISSAIAQLSAEDPDARWLCAHCSFIVANFAMANGARVMNATNFYPDVEKWTLLDPEGIFEEQTNRYANIGVELSSKKQVELLAPDNILVRLTSEDLRRLNIRYLIAPVDQDELFVKEGLEFEYIDGQDGLGIFRLSYEEEPDATT